MLSENRESGLIFVNCTTTGCPLSSWRRTSSRTAHGRGWLQPARAKRVSYSGKICKTAQITSTRVHKDAKIWQKVLTFFHGLCCFQFWLPTNIFIKLRLEILCYCTSTVQCTTAFAREPKWLPRGIPRGHLSPHGSLQTTRGMGRILRAHTEASVRSSTVFGVCW